MENRPYKSSAAERITGTELRLGRKIWASSELPDDLARALWHKQRLWQFADFLSGIGHEDDRHGYHAAIDGRDEAAERHAAIINMLWQQRRMLRLADACVTRTVALTAWAKGETLLTDLNRVAADSLWHDDATSRAMERL